MSWQDQESCSIIPDSLVYTFIGIYIAVSLVRSFRTFRHRDSKPSVLSLLITYKKNKPSENYNNYGNKNTFDSLVDQSSHTTNDSLFGENKEKLFFDIGQYIMEFTCLEQLKQTACCLTAKSSHKKILRTLKLWMKTFLVFVLEHCVWYLLPLEYLLYYVTASQRDKHPQIGNGTKGFIIILDSLRLFCNIFLVSFMSSRREFMRMSSDEISRRWIYKKIKFHLYRSVYLTAAFEIVKNIAIGWLANMQEDNFEITRTTRPQLNIVVLSIYCLRYIILFVVLDIKRSSEFETVRNNQAVFSEQLRLNAIKEFLRIKLPRSQELEQIVSQNRKNEESSARLFQNIEKDMQKAFQQEFEGFKRDYAKLIVNKSQNLRQQARAPQSVPFTCGLIYNTLQFLFFLPVYILLMVELDWTYTRTPKNNKDIQIAYCISFLIAYVVEMIFFPEIVSAILKIDVSFDPEAVDGVFSPKTGEKYNRVAGAEDDLSQNLMQYS